MKQLRIVACNPADDETVRSLLQDDPFYAGVEVVWDLDLPVISGRLGANWAVEDIEVHPA